jgi:hypothetical protein
MRAVVARRGAAPRHVLLEDGKVDRNVELLLAPRVIGPDRSLDQRAVPMPQTTARSSVSVHTRRVARQRRNRRVASSAYLLDNFVELLHNLAEAFKVLHVQPARPTPRSHASEPNQLAEALQFFQFDGEIKELLSNAQSSS